MIIHLMELENCMNDSSGQEGVRCYNNFCKNKKQNKHGRDSNFLFPFKFWLKCNICILTTILSFIWLRSQY